MSRLRLTARARHDLSDIWDHSKEQWGRERANAYVGELIATCERLAATPGIAPAYGLLRPGYRRWPVGGHVVFFRQTDDGIQIVRILHQRMDARINLR